MYRLLSISIVTGIFLAGTACETFQPVEEETQLGNNPDPDGTPNEPDSKPIETDTAFDPGNVPPRANADFSPTELFPGDTVNLNGAASSDLDGDVLQYFWQVTQKPVGSVATVMNPEFMNAQLYVDRDGDYVVELLVDDRSHVSSDVIEFTVEAANLPPIANPGPSLSFPVGQTAEINGSASSDPDSDEFLDFYWSFVSKPGGSTAKFVGIDNQPATIARFQIDRVGTYVVELVVNDNDPTDPLDSQPVYVEIRGFDDGSLGGGSGSSDCLSCAAAVDPRFRTELHQAKQRKSVAVVLLPLMLGFAGRRRRWF